MSELLTPKLRFPKFDDNWSTHNLSEISEQIKRKKEDISSEDNILTISANKGFISQKERWDNVIAGGSLKKYTYLKQNEFSYNRGNSKSFKFGCIYKLNNYKNALVPNVYHSFKITYGNTDFFEQLFKSKILDKQLIKMITSTARMDGLLNISAKNFFNINVNFPNDLKEQEKIGSFLKTIDTKIILLEQKYDNYLNFKKYLMQQIFTQKLRFNFTDEWKKSKLKEICNVQDGTHTTPNYVDEGIPFYSVENLTSNVPPKFISKEEHEKLIKRCKPKFGDILITRIGTLAKSKVIDWEEEFSIYVSLALLSSIKINARFLNYYIQTDKYQKDFLKKSLLLAVPQKINLKDLNETIVEYPSSKEQEKIVNVFDSIDTKIAHINIELNNTKNFKRGLLQQMFI